MMFPISNTVPASMENEPVSVQLLRVASSIVADYGDSGHPSAKEDCRWSFAISAISWRSLMN